MLVKIITLHRHLVNFIFLLHLTLSKPQEEHLTRVADALLVCEGDKNLSALNRVFWERKHPTNVADFFRQAPWSGEEVREATWKFLLRWLMEQALREEVEGQALRVIIVIDDSYLVKSKGCRKIEPVSWYRDHRAPGETYIKGVVVVTVKVWVGRFCATLNWRIYLRGKRVRQLRRWRKKAGKSGEKIRYRSKYALAREMLEEMVPELKALLPANSQVYVVFDNWYAATKLLRWIRRQGWHVICGVKKNRKLDGKPLSSYDLRHRRWRKIHVERATSERVYRTYRLEGELSDVGEAGVVIVLRGHKRGQDPEYLWCSEASLRTEAILEIGGHRWDIEVDYEYLKGELGVEDFRLQEWEAVEKYLSVVFLVLGYLQWQRGEAQAEGSAEGRVELAGPRGEDRADPPDGAGAGEPAGAGGEVWQAGACRARPVQRGEALPRQAQRVKREKGAPSLADLIRKHREDHAREVLELFGRMVLEEGAVEPVIERFLAQNA